MTELDSKAFKAAIKSEQPSVVDFWASWCMPCKIFAPVLEEISAEMDGKANFYKLNIDDYGDIAEEYSIVSIPTVIVFKDGEPVERLVGVRAKEEVLEIVGNYL